MPSADFVITSVGTINMDWIAKVPVIPVADAETTILELIFRFGGAAANFSVSCTRLGYTARLVGCVGDDEEGQTILKELSTEGVVLRDVKIIEGETTGFTIITVDPKGERAVLMHKGANQYLENYIDEVDFKGSNIIYVAGTPFPLVKKLWTIASDVDAIFAYNAGAELSDSKLTLTEIVETINRPGKPDVLFISSRAYERLTKEKPTEGFIATRMKEIVDGKDIIVVVTMGAAGAVIVSKDQILKAEAFEVNAVDSTGAGDAFAAGFLTRIAQGKSLEEAGIFASAVSAIKCTIPGAQEGLPTSEEVEEFLKERRKENTKKVK